MSFQNPQLLYGLLALAIPILIHFFNFRKTRKVYFSSTRFLQKVKEAQATRKRLKHYLILASRLLFMFFLIVAFAQPFLPSSDETPAGSPVTIYLDNSQSMSNEVEEGQTGLERGISYLDELVRLFPETSNYRLLTNDFLPGSRTLHSSREMEELITEIKYSNVSRSAEDIMSRVKSDQGDDKLNLFWLTDFQNSVVGTAPKFDSVSHVNLIPVQFSNQTNVYVDSAYVENPIMITDEQVQLHVIFRNIGPQPVSEVIAKVYMDQVQSGTASVSLSANGTQEVIFDLLVDRSKAHAGKIVFEEFPVTFDNEFNFVINVPDPINVLEIKESSATSPVALVYGNEKLFNLTAQSASNLNYNTIQLSDLVVINGLNEIDPPLITALNRYMGNGGTLMIIPGSEPDLLNYQMLLPDLVINDSSAMQDIAAPDFGNPFFQNVFEDENSRLQMPQAVNLMSIQGVHEDILTFGNGQPFLSLRRRQGDYYILAAPLTDQMSNFARHAMFVPVMYKIAAGSAVRQNELYRYINRSAFTFKHDSTSMESIYKLMREDEEIIPEQHVDQNRVHFDVPKFTINAGIYTLMLEEEEIGLVAFNTDPAESDIRQPSMEEINQQWQGNYISILEASDTQNFASAINERYIGRPLWKEALMLSLLFLLIEVLLIRFMP